MKLTEWFSSLFGSRKEIEDLQSQNENMRHQRQTAINHALDYDDLKSDFEILATEVRRYRSNEDPTSMLEFRVNELGVQNNKLQEQNDKLQQLDDIHRRQYKNVHAQWREAQDLAFESGDLKAEIKDLKKQERRSEKVTALKSRINNLTNQTNRLEKQIVAKDTQIADAQQRLRNLHCVCDSYLQNWGSERNRGQGMLTRFRNQADRFWNMTDMVQDIYDQLPDDVQNQIDGLVERYFAVVTESE